MGFFNSARKKEKQVLSVLQKKPPPYCPSAKSDVQDKKSYKKSLTQYRKEFGMRVSFLSQILRLLNSHPVHKNLTLTLLEKNPAIVSEVAEFFCIPHLAEHLNQINLQLCDLRSIELDLLWERYKYENKLPSGSELLLIGKSQLKKTFTVFKIARQEEDEQGMRRLTKEYLNLGSLVRMINLKAEQVDRVHESSDIMGCLILLQKQVAKMEKVLQGVLEKIVAKNQQKIRDINDALTPLIGQGSKFAYLDEDAGEDAVMEAEAGDGNRGWKNFIDSLHATRVICAQFLQKLETEIDLMMFLSQNLTNKKAVDAIKILSHKSQQMCKGVQVKIGYIADLVNKLSGNLSEKTSVQENVVVRRKTTNIWCDIKRVILLEVSTLTLIGLLLGQNKLFILDLTLVTSIATFFILIICHPSRRVSIQRQLVTGVKRQL